MCDERERLIDYLYEEGDLRQRTEVQAHLADCASCREEIAALRAVRQDLMAWAVPATEPVWRPLPAARPALTWRDVPNWVLAVAASVVLVAGASGAAAARFFGPASGASPVSVAADSSRTPGTAAVLTAPASSGDPAATAIDMARLSRRIDDVESRLSRQIGLLASHQAQRVVSSGMAGSSAEIIQDLQRRLATAEARLDKQGTINIELDRQVQATKRALRSDDGMLVRAGWTGSTGTGR